MAPPAAINQINHRIWEARGPSSRRFNLKKIKVIKWNAELTADQIKDDLYSTCRYNKRIKTIQTEIFISTPFNSWSIFSQISSVNLKYWCVQRWYLWSFYILQQIFRFNHQLDSNFFYFLLLRWLTTTLKNLLIKQFTTTLRNLLQPWCPQISHWCLPCTPGSRCFGPFGGCFLGCYFFGGGAACFLFYLLWSVIGFLFVWWQG